MKAALYLRVSTDKQEADNQRAALERYAAAHDYDVVEVYEDLGSGSDPGLSAFNRMMHAARLREWDILLFWAWDRLTRRGIEATFTIMRRLEQSGVEWESLQEPFLSSTSPAATRELLAAILAWVAEQERRRISERTKAAIARRRALGQPWGRPPGAKDKRPRKSPRRKGTLSVALSDHRDE